MLIIDGREEKGFIQEIGIRKLSITIQGKMSVRMKDVCVVDDGCWVQFRLIGI